MAGPHPIKTTTNAASATSQTLSLPQPQTFDVLPLLHEHLASVDAFFNQNASGLPSDYDDLAGNGVDDIGSSYCEKATGNPIQPLNPKDLPTKALDVKARIRAALREVEKLPDVERTVEEQEEEIAELKGRIARQKEMLRGLGEMARKMDERDGGVGK